MDKTGEHLVAIYALAASVFLFLGLAVELPWAYVPLAVAGQVAATAWIYRKIRIGFLKKIMTGLVAVFAAMNYEQIALFAGLALYGAAGEDPGYFAVSHALDAPLLKLGVPALLIGLALRMLKGETTERPFVHVLFGAAFTLSLMTLYYVLRGFFHGADAGALAVSAGFMERGVVTAALAVAGAGTLYAARHSGWPFLAAWGRGVFHLSMLRLAWFDLLVFNPFWTGGQFVGDLPVLNGVTMIYGAGALLALWVAGGRGFAGAMARGRGLKTAYKILSLTLVFAFSSLTVRQYFHGGFLSQGGFSPAELYSYSVAWLVTGLGLLAAGIVLRSRAARTASLAFVVLAVLKVFLFDASALEGLFRVFSFLGLGMSLMALSFFYTRFVFGDAGPRRGG